MPGQNPISSIISKSIKERTPHIGAALKARALDFAIIQESWVKKDRKALLKYSGLSDGTYFSVPRTIGSGLFNLTNGEQERNSFREFILNGELKDIKEADAYAGKGVAMTTAIVRGLPVSFFNTHTIARYNGDGEREEDRHTIDRLLQVFEIFRHVVEQTDSDAFVIAGDFNMRSFQTEYRFWRALTSLDGIREEEKDPAFCTFCADNTFHNNSEGQLDYVFISPRLRLTQYGRDFDVPFKDKKGKAMNLSDHYGWSAGLAVNTSPAAVSPEQARSSCLASVRQLRKRMEGQLEMLKGQVQTKGVEDRICRQCRVIDGLNALAAYEKALVPVNQGKDDERLRALRVRLDSYFDLFQ